MSEVIAEAYYPLPINELLPQSWTACFIGAAIEDIRSGFPSGAHNNESDGIAHLRPMNVSREGDIDISVLKFVSPEVSPLRVSAGDVLFNNTNSPELIGKTAVIPPAAAQMAFSNHMTRLSPPKGLNPSFVAYQLHFLWMSGYFRYRCTNHVNQASIS